MSNTDTPQPVQDAEDLIRYLRGFKKSGLSPLKGEFFPTISYPPQTMYPRTTEAEVLKGYSPPEDGAYDVYAHIPFCERACTYCHFGFTLRPTGEEVDRYLGALEKEMDLYLRKLNLQRIRARSILIGGGTPTYLDPERLGRFLRSFTDRLDRTGGPQFNVDSDPKSLLDRLGKERLDILKSYGVSRFTIGINALDDDVLKKMNRPHSAQEAVDSIHRLKGMGFPVAIEFIYGYPGQTPGSWAKTMERAISLGADEIQIYRLRITPHGDHVGTIRKQFQAEEDRFLSDEETFRMKQAAHALLYAAGYQQRATRVFSKDPQMASQYSKSQFCTLKEIIGFGYTSISLFRDRAAKNTQYFEEYYSLIEQGRLPINRGKIRTRDEQLRCALLLPLKARAVEKTEFQSRTGESLDDVFRKKIGRLKDLGLIQEDAEELKLTTLGRFFADEVCYQFYHPDYMPFPREAFADGEMNPYNDVAP